MGTVQPQLHQLGANGTQLAYWEWYPHLRGQQPTLLFVHATGFHGRVWDQVVRRLPERHIIALEQRGHGRSETRAFDSWADFGRDAAAFVQALGLTGVIGIGHSMGAHSLILAAAHHPELFSRLILCDPVVVSPQAYHPAPMPDGYVHPASGRVNRFESVQAMKERFANKPPYSVFDRAAFEDYCDWALRPADDGNGLQLCCDPRTEAGVYMRARLAGAVYASVLALELPVLVIRAREPTPDRKLADFTSSPTWPALARYFQRGRDVYLPEHTHLLPMQDPERIAALIWQELDPPVLSN